MYSTEHAFTPAPVSGASEQQKRSDSLMACYYLDNKEHLHIFESEKLNFALQRKVIRALRMVGRDKEAENIKKCGKVFTLYQEKKSSLVRSIPYHCGHRFCQRCQKRRVAKFWKRIESAFKAMKQPKMLTLTVKNVPNIDSDYFKYVRGCLSKLRRRKCFKQVLGGVYSIETTYNKKRKDWHVHIHALIDSETFINRDDLVEAWKKITSDSWGVDIRLVDQNALKEVLKYECKLADFVGDSALIDEYLVAVKNARLFHSFGNVFDFENEIDVVEELKDQGYTQNDAEIALNTVKAQHPTAKGRKLRELSRKQVRSDTGEMWQFMAKVTQPGDQFTDPSGFVWTWELCRIAAYDLEALSEKL